MEGLPYMVCTSDAMGRLIGDSFIREVTSTHFMRDFTTSDLKEVTSSEQIQLEELVTVEA